MRFRIVVACALLTLTSASRAATVRGVEKLTDPAFEDCMNVSMENETVLAIQTWANAQALSVDVTLGETPIFVINDTDDNCEGTFDPSEGFSGDACAVDSLLGAANAVLDEEFGSTATSRLLGSLYMAIAPEDTEFAETFEEFALSNQTDPCGCGARYMDCLGLPVDPVTMGLICALQYICCVSECTGTDPCGTDNF